MTSYKKLHVLLLGGPLKIGALGATVFALCIITF